jgi:hypothetical protein
MHRLLFSTILALALVSTTRDVRADEASVPWRAPSGAAVDLAYANGLWGGTYAQALLVKLPFHPNWGFVLRPMALYDTGDASSRIDLGGRLELYGASPVFLNFARIYGGGGAQVFQAVSGVSGAKPTFGGGGHFGFEFFYTPRSSFFIEIGGTSPAQGGIGGGGTAMAGVTFYLFASSEPPAQAAAR